VPYHTCTGTLFPSQVLRGGGGGGGGGGRGGPRGGGGGGGLGLFRVFAGVGLVGGIDGGG